MKQNNMQNEDDFDISLSDDDLALIEASIAKQEKYDLEEKEILDEEIFVILNEFAETANDYISSLYKEFNINISFNNQGKPISNFMDFTNNLLDNAHDPYAKIIYNALGGLEFQGFNYYYSGRMSAFLSTIGGEAMLLWDIRVNPDNNNLIIRLIPEKGNAVSSIFVELDLTDPKIIHEFPYEKNNYSDWTIESHKAQKGMYIYNSDKSYELKKSIFEFLTRFFCLREEYPGSFAYSDAIKSLASTESEANLAKSSAIVLATIEINKCIRKNKIKSDRENFQKIYANKGIESW